MYDFEKARRIPFTDEMLRAIDEGRKTETRRPIRLMRDGQPAKCIYGDRGDLLLATGWHVFLDAEGNVCEDKARRDRILYRVDWTGDPQVDEWRPPMFLPKDWANRYLANLGTEKEKLRSITEQQAIAEGIMETSTVIKGFKHHVYRWEESGTNYGCAVAAFRSLWDSIHEERGLLFDTNPDVWRVKFKKLEVKNGRESS